jgi:uncharacterized protein
MESVSDYALITGASMGLGKEIAFELAKRKYNLLLVSLENEGLSVLCKELSILYGIKVYKFEDNLADPAAVYRIAQWAENYKVSVLVNNAGIGRTILYEDTSPEYIDHLIQINIRASAMLTRLMLPKLKVCEKSFILNVGSMASFSPIPYKVIYTASKAFINFFSKSLAIELKNTNVSVSVIHPGPMKTNPEVIRRIESQGMLGRMTLLTAKKMAKIAVMNMFKKNSFIIPGFSNKLSRLLLNLVPLKLKANFLSVVYRREAEKGKNISFTGYKTSS